MSIKKITVLIGESEILVSKFLFVAILKEALLSINLAFAELLPAGCAVNTFTVYTEPDDCGSVAAAMQEKGYVFASAQVEMVPQNYVKLTDAGDIKNMEKLIDMLEDNDDVQKVYFNCDLDLE